MKTRIPKYRVWDTEEKRFIEWFNADPMIRCADGEIFCHERTLKSDGTYGEDVCTNERYFSKKLILQQYIGINDKHDIEICEGDILKVVVKSSLLIFSTGEFLGTVVWDQSKLTYELSNITPIHAGKNASFSTSLLEDSGREIEVVSHVFAPK